MNGFSSLEGGKPAVSSFDCHSERSEESAG
jgi:hypothetical protein